MVQNGPLHSIMINMPFKWQCPVGYGAISEPYDVVNTTHNRRQQPKGIDSSIDQRQTVASTRHTSTRHATRNGRRLLASLEHDRNFWRQGRSYGILSMVLIVCHDKHFKTLPSSVLLLRRSPTYSGLYMLCGRPMLRHPSLLLILWHNSFSALGSWYFSFSSSPLSLTSCCLLCGLSHCVQQTGVTTASCICGSR